MTFLIAGSDLADAFGANWLNVIIAVILVVGGSGGIVAWFRLRSQNSKILVDAAQGAVVVQTTVIDNLRQELETQKRRATESEATLSAEIAELRTHLAELNSLRTRVRELEHQNEILKAENTMLQSQVKALSKMVHDQEDRANGSKETHTN